MSASADRMEGMDRRSRTARYELIFLSGGILVLLSVLAAFLAARITMEADVRGWINTTVKTTTDSIRENEQAEHSGMWEAVNGLRASVDSLRGLVAEQTGGGGR